MVNIFVIAILLMPWVALPFPEIIDQMRLPKAVFFDVFCLSVIAYGFYCGQRFAYKNKYLAWFLGFLFVSFFMNWFLPFMITVNGQRALNIWALESMIHVVLSAVTAYMAMTYLDKADYIRIAKSICISSFLVSVFCLCQFFGYDPLVGIVRYKVYEINHVSALLDHPNMVGNFMALSIPFYALFIKQRKYLLMGLAVIASLLASKSSISIFAVGLIVPVFVILNYLKNKKVVALCLVILSSFLVFILMTPKFNKITTGGTGRFEVWGYAIAKIKDNPLFGHGVGVFKTLGIRTVPATDLSGNTVNMKWNFAHNDWLERTVEVGIVGLFLLVLVVINTFRSFNYREENLVGRCYLMSFVALLIVMCASFPMEYPPLALLGMIGFMGSERL